MTINNNPCSSRHLSNIVCGLAQCFKDLFVVLQVDVGEHVSSHGVSFAQVSLQAFFVDLLLKLGDDWPRLDQADAGNRGDVFSSQTGAEISVKAAALAFSTGSQFKML